MKYSGILLAASFAVASAAAQGASSCTDLAKLTMDGVELTKTKPIAEGAMIPVPYAGTIGPLPAHCLVDGVIHQRKGVNGEEYGIGFALALPSQDAWNGDFMMQGGGGSNGVINYPLGSSYSGDTSALIRGFAVASTDTGHKSKSGGFDFAFMHDQQDYLDFAFEANAEVAKVSKEIIDHYYGYQEGICRTEECIWRAGFCTPVRES